MPSRRGIEAIDLWVKQATPDVPNDGKYHVVHQGKIVASYRGEAKALAEYRRLIKEIGYTPPKPEASDAAEYWSRAGDFRAGGKLRNVH
jgi:hypothetical protein